MKRMVICILVLSFLAGVSPMAAEKPYAGETMYVYAGIFPYMREHISRYIVPELEEKWGIHIIVEEMGNADMLAKAVVERRNPTASIYGLDTELQIQAAEMGLTQPLDTERIPNLADCDDWVYLELDGQVYALSTVLKGIGLLYNADAFAREGLAIPSSFYDLWREDLEGRVSYPSPTATGGTYFLLHMAVLEGGSIDDIGPGIEKLKTLNPNLHSVHTFSSDARRLMQLGEVWLTVQSSNQAVALQAAGFPAAWVPAEGEGIPYQSGALSIPANAKYVDVAYDFLDLFFSVEFMTRRLLWEGGTVPNARAWTVISPAELERIPLTREDLDNLTPYDWAEIAERREEWIERYRMEVGR